MTERESDACLTSNQDLLEKLRSVTEHYESAVTEREDLREHNDELQAAWRSREEEFSQLHKKTVLSFTRTIQCLSDIAVSNLVDAETVARSLIVQRERSELARLPFTSFFRQTYLGSDPENNTGFCESLHRLWRFTSTCSHINSLHVRETLCGLTHVTSLALHAAGQPCKYRDAFDVPSKDLLHFLPSVVFKLPALQELELCALPSLRDYCLPFANEIPRSVWGLNLPHCRFDAADLLELHSLCPQLKEIWVSAECCDCWSPFEAEECGYERMQLLSRACDEVVMWWESE